MGERLRLRSRPATLKDSDVGDMLKKYGFYCKAFAWNRDYANDEGDFKSDFRENGDGTVTDMATGLMWQKGHAPDYGRWDEAQPYIDRLNRERFAGYTDWRLPTIEEWASLMTRERLNDGLFLSPVFSNRMWFWSCDPGGAGAGREWGGAEFAWAINFNYGSLFCLEVNNGQDIRAVRAAVISPGRQFYVDHVDYLIRGDIDGLLRDHYHEDAELVTFDGVLKGRAALRQFLVEVAPRITGKIVGVSLQRFVESQDVILYEAGVETETRGTVTVTNAVYLTNGKVFRHIATTSPDTKTTKR